ncbi:hypothetical protein ACFGVR_18075 [Mucilaginibacter sp. AW1-3]
MGFQDLNPGFDVFMNIFLGLLIIVWGISFYMFSLDKNRLGFMRRFSRDRTLKYSSFGLIIFGSVMLYQAFFS